MSYIINEIKSENTHKIS